MTRMISKDILQTVVSCNCNYDIDFIRSSQFTRTGITFVPGAKNNGKKPVSLSGRVILLSFDKRYSIRFYEFNRLTTKNL
jgi:hypothetical protein